MSLQRSLNQLGRNAAVWLKRQSPTILSIIAAAGVVGTAVMAAKATPKALKDLEEAEDENGPLTTPEKVVVMAPSYIPAAAMGVGTVICVFGANALNKRQQAMIISAYSLLDQTYKEYKDKVIEVLGRDGHRDIQGEIVKDHFNEEFKDKDDYIKETPLYYEPFSKQFFNIEEKDFIQAKYDLNRNFQLRGYSSLDEFLAFLRIDGKKCPIADTIGWDYDTLLIDYGAQWIDIGAYPKEMDGGIECFIIEYQQDPVMDDQLYPGIRDQIEMDKNYIPSSLYPREICNDHYRKGVDAK